MPSFSDVTFVFLDRDGVVNRPPPGGRYVTSWEDFHILPGVERAIARLNQTSRKVIIATNQRGIALGLLSEADLQTVHENLQRHLERHGAHIDGVYYCPHDVGVCSCRKPGIGLFELAFRDFRGACAGNSTMIGDSDSDILAGANAGMKTILVGEQATDRWKAQPNASGRTLLEIVETYLNG